ncbi:pyridoxal phosphate-dependent deaminase, putative [hydrothermal vent metagenome]|uniref:Pyridoxal phosphate-dependent deaminase, putative n=1 Tax=hydrothermal vent metagenome TaxID=652676 RepID=A0A3B1BLB0_9ZZZZ
MIDFEKYSDEKSCVTTLVTLPGGNNGVNVLMKRTDLVHPVISGNKWYKMKYNIVEMQKQGIDTLLTFGGAYSNHIHAASHAGKLFGFKTIGLIRGEEHLPLNSTLQSAINNGMELHYVDRTTFRKRETEEFLNSLKEKFGNVYILPVGGTNTVALKGCAEIIDQIEIDYDYICSASGSGGTFAGLVAGLQGDKKAMAFPALKGGEFLEKVISDLVSNYTGKSFSNWQLNTNYHFGGFAKLSRELIEFTHEFNKLNGFELDYIYTNKMMYGIADLIRKGFLKSGETIVAIHSGGLQGNEGMKEKVSKNMIKN